LLIHIVAVVAGLPGCSSPPASHGPCGEIELRPKNIVVTGDVACSIIGRNKVFEGETAFRSDGCFETCPGYGMCNLPSEYVQAFTAAQPDAGAAMTDAGSSGDGAPTCPVVKGFVGVQCAPGPCEGRRTAGSLTPFLPRAASLGDYFAACSYLEAVSVHAFARLGAELAAHGAPSVLVEKARRAEVEEARHAEITATLARTFGATPERPSAPRGGVRSLFEIARENAVEGCVRETYGAAMALFRAARATDPRVREAMRSIAPDECAHAELSWEVAAWMLDRLGASEREEIRRAMTEAMRELLADAGDMVDARFAPVAGVPGREERRRLAEMLEVELFRVAA
jgi:hypothetical protein